MKTKKATPYLYILPTMLIIAVVFAFPILEIFRLSFSSPEGTKFSLGNFQYIFSDPVFWASVSHNLTLLILVPIILGFALLLALFLYERVRGWLLHRSIVFLPYVMPIAVIGIAFSYLYQYNGIINLFLRSIGLGSFALDWLGSPKLVLPTIMTVIIWRETGFGVVLFLARLLSLPQEVLEASTVDGANWLQRHIYITMPQLKPIIMFFVVTEAISMLTWVFSYVYVMSGGGPAFNSYVLEIYLWQSAFSLGSPGVASAIAVFLFVSSLLLIAVGYKYIVSEEEMI